MLGRTTPDAPRAAAAAPRQEKVMAESTPATQVATTGGEGGVGSTAAPLSRPRLWAVLGLVLLADALDMND